VVHAASRVAREAARAQLANLMIPSLAARSRTAR
jgi:hypothetical protein